jgi:hypothetical protein
VLRVLEKQSIHLFFGATYGWHKLDNALNHSHLPSSTKKSAKKLGVKAGDVSKAPVPFLPKRRPSFTTQTLNHSMPQQHYNAHHSIRPYFSAIFSYAPPRSTPLCYWSCGRESSRPTLHVWCTHTQGHNQSAANGFRRPGYNGYSDFNGTPR